MKITLPQITNGQDLSTLNSNFQAIASQLNTNVLYRVNVNSEPNTMGNDLDFNGYSIYNVADIRINNISVLQLIGTASTSAATAVSAAQAASASQTASATSASQAAASAVVAQNAASQSGSLIAVNNLSDLTNLTLAKTNLQLDQVSNTSDANKPVSTAQQTALNLKANLASPNFSGTVTVPTGFNVTNTTGQANFNINGAAGNSRQFQFMTSGSVRWTVATDQTAEASGNLGSDFGLYRFDNTGAYIDNPLKFFRNSGQATFSVRPIFGANTPYDTGNLNPQAIPGITNGSNAAAGVVGEYIEAVAAATSTSSGTVNNLCQFNLTPGDWDVTGWIHFLPAATTVMSGRLGSISTTSATVGPAKYTTLDRSTIGAGLDQSFPIPTVRINLTVTTTIILVSSVVFTTSTCQVEGVLSARRVR